MLIDTYHFNPHRRESQNTLLHVATWNGALDTVKMLIERYGLNPHTEGQQGGRPLHMAVSSGNAELVKYLVDEYHLNPHTTDGHGYTILHEVGSNNHNLRQMIINDYRVTTEKKEQDRTVVVYSKSQNKVSPAFWLSPTDNHCSSLLRQALATIAMT